MDIIKYSHAFKLQVIREVENGKITAEGARRKYNINGKTTVMKWVRLYGSGKYGKVIQVQTPDEVSEIERLRKQLHRAKESLADAHMELALEKAFLSVACEQLDQSVEGFKKKHDGKRPTGPSKQRHS